MKSTIFLASLLAALLAVPAVASAAGKIAITPKARKEKAAAKQEKKRQKAADAQIDAALSDADKAKERREQSKMGTHRGTPDPKTGKTKIPMSSTKKGEWKGAHPVGERFQNSAADVRKQRGSGSTKAKGKKP